MSLCLAASSATRESRILRPAAGRDATGPRLSARDGAHPQKTKGEAFGQHALYVGCRGRKVKQPNAGYVWRRIGTCGARLFVPFRDGKPAGEPIDFATGFLTEDGKARGRPVGVTVDPRGALIVADDLANTVWRIAASQPAGAATQPVGAATEPADEAPSAEGEPAQNP